MSWPFSLYFGHAMPVTSHTSSAALPRPSPHYLCSTHLLMSFTHEPHTAMEQEGHSPTTAGTKSTLSNLSWCFDTSKQSAPLLSCFSQFLVSLSRLPQVPVQPCTPCSYCCLARLPALPLGVRCVLLTNITLLSPLRKEEPVTWMERARSIPKALCAMNSLLLCWALSQRL